jgi:hypothetical protein
MRACRLGATELARGDAASRVIPAKAGIQGARSEAGALDPGFRRDDEEDRWIH